MGAGVHAQAVVPNPPIQLSDLNYIGYQRKLEMPLNSAQSGIAIASSPGPLRAVRGRQVGEAFLRRGTSQSGANRFPATDLLSQARI